MLNIFRRVAQLPVGRSMESKPKRVLTEKAMREQRTMIEKIMRENS